MRRIMMHALVLATWALTGTAGMPVSAADVPSGVPLGRLEKLTKGINLSHWFSQSSNYSSQHLQTYDTAKDAALIKALGFRHVRFAFNDETVVDRENPAVLNPQKMNRFDAAMDMLLAADLAVIVDFHPEEEYKKAVEKDDVAVSNFVGMWRALARHLSSRDPERVFFEVMNEPMVKDPARWNAIQTNVLTAMRESAPRHTLIATAATWSEVYALELVEVVPDRNVVYNFHCYEPFKFTHQNAPWVGELTKNLKNAPYPSSPQAVNKILAGLPDEKARRLMIQYGNENWDARKINAFIARAAKWGRKHGVALTCNEFGVIRTALAADRNRCIEDVRKALEKHNIGWCMWDYAGGFGVATGKSGERVADPATIQALGLTPPRQEAIVPEHKADLTTPPKTEAGTTFVSGPEGSGSDSSHGRFGAIGSSQRKTPPAVSAGTTYYVDTLAGDDSADGRAAAPWRSLERVNLQVFAPGETILFKAGCRWQGQLRPQGSGSEGRSIRIDRYGEGPLPIIDLGAATGAAVQLSNQEYWEIRHLAAYGYKDLAAEIADKTVANAIKNGISEHYDSITGKALGVPYLGMTCSLLTLMLDGLCRKHSLRVRNGK